ncbi:lipid A deacylase LpxR family protein [Neolewinella aurantiaca]|uniref:Lipid A deacylase LpxR family protein n=1 Tax=Neolewinella aurantiaca TaxID=2602767 RepID=A0A5C7FBR6_9BACT|nr:lipid A-modifier LpxR family protein [Neolewinella aurantiaca]TXF88209.1 lipid A deacylase LpxR family protein [Neolewinella aurantiaca]
MSKALFLIGTILAVFSFALPGQSTWGHTYFTLKVANDVLYLPIKTDQYFTSGLNFEFGKRERFSTPLRAGGTITAESYWRLTQNIYTPKRIEAKSLLKNDRPFASYLVATRGKSFTDDQMGFGLRWELTAGILGRYAGGGKIQNAFHDLLPFADEVPGWSHEVKPDVILNYELKLSQRFDMSPRLSFTPAVYGRLGTLYTNLAPELKFSWLAIRIDEQRTLRFDLFGNGKLVAYDATLSGGLLNRDDRYRGKINPNALVGTLGFDGVIDYRGLRLSGGLRHLTTEFRGGDPHAWAWFSIGIQPGKKRLNPVVR